MRGWQRVATGGWLTCLNLEAQVKSRAKNLRRQRVRGVVITGAVLALATNDNRQALAKHMLECKADGTAIGEGDTQGCAQSRKEMHAR